MRTVTYLRENEKVLTAPVTKNIIEAHRINRTTDLHGKLSSEFHENRMNDQVQLMSAAFYANRTSEAAIGIAVGKEIAKLPLEQNIFDENGHRRYRIMQNQKIHDQNARSQTGGNG